MTGQVFKFVGVPCARYAKEGRLVCDVVLTVDPRALAEALAYKAAHNKSRKSKLRVGVEARAHNVRTQP